MPAISDHFIAFALGLVCAKVFCYHEEAIGMLMDATVHGNPVDKKKAQVEGQVKHA